jgi:hypothetical protein
MMGMIAAGDLMPTHDTPTALFSATAHVLARAGTRDETLAGLLEALVEWLDVGSAAIFAVGTAARPLELAATAGLPEPAAAGLATAVENAAHPIARTASDGTSSFDVLPTAPGGPALRSHVPLIATRDRGPAVVGVLAVAHDAPMTPSAPLLEAVADLAAATFRANDDSRAVGSPSPSG